jgi:hypothetical protein
VRNKIIKEILSAMKPDSIVQAVKMRLGQAGQTLSAYWLKVDKDRNIYAEEIRACRGELPIFPLIIREQLFTNPNTVLNDLVIIIDNNRERLEHDYRYMCIGGKINCALLLLGRSELCLAQASSPVTLPEWFPFIGGTTIEIYIEDLTWTAAAPLNTEEMRVADISRQLFYVEKILLNRLQKVQEKDHNAGNQLCEYLRRLKDDNILGIVNNAMKNLSSVSNPTAFRPSVKEGKSLLALLWEMQAKLASTELHKLSKALAAALNIQEDGAIGHESIFNTIYRPGHSEKNSIRIARNIIITTATACRLITVAAHADNYESYPLTLISSVAHDITHALRDIELLLERMPE